MTFYKRWSLNTNSENYQDDIMKKSFIYTFVIRQFNSENTGSSNYSLKIYRAVANGLTFSY